MIPKADIRAEADRLRSFFEAKGARVFEADVLQPVEALLNLYGEDIRARAFVTHDPLRGEMMLRPDFTVPLVQRYLATGGGSAKYTYSGEVFRRQEDDEDRPTEYFQVGYEMFGGDNDVEADAEVFATMGQALGDANVTATIGSFDILTAAIDSLETPDRRKKALRRHLWRPGRFDALIERYSRPAPPPPNAPDAQVPHVGLRSSAEIEARVNMLAKEAKTEPLAADQVSRMRALMGVRAPAPDAVNELKRIAESVGPIFDAVERLEKRLQAMARRGVEPASIRFETSFGLTSLEYYSGFVFGFSAPGMAPVASGGRYDLLTKALDGDGSHPAVGGVIRPEILLELKAGET